MNKLLAALAVSFALAGTAQAQPVTKLTANLDAETREQIWCSAVFFEESYWYEDDSDWGVYYDNLAFELDAMVMDTLDGMGMPIEEQDEIWDVYDSEAFELAEGDENGFLAQLNTCEEIYGDLIRKPKK